MGEEKLLGLWRRRTRWRGGLRLGDSSCSRRWWIFPVEKTSLKKCYQAV